MSISERMLKRKDGPQVVAVKENKGIPYMTFPALEETGVVIHGFSTRLGGVSQGDCATMNFALGRGDDPANVRENYRRMAAAMGFAPEKMVLAYQTHTTHIRQVTVEDLGKGYDRERDYRDIDGLMTDVPGAVLVTSYADCVPLLFVDPVRRVIAASHSGWRGTVARMGRRTVEAMQQTYGCRPEDLIVAIGPSICQDCYEVSEDVAEAFAKELGLELPAAEDGGAEGGGAEGGGAEGGGAEGGGAEGGGAEANGCDSGEIAKDLTPSILKKTPGKLGKYQLDLQQANVQILTEAGVLPEHISVTDVCTCCNKDVIFSHRGSQGRRGNMGAFLSLREESTK